MRSGDSWIPAPRKTTFRNLLIADCLFRIEFIWPLEPDSKGWSRSSSLRWVCWQHHDATVLAACTLTTMFHWHFFQTSWQLMTENEWRKEDVREGVKLKKNSDCTAGKQLKWKHSSPSIPRRLSRHQSGTNMKGNFHVFDLSVSLSPFWGGRDSFRGWGHRKTCSRRPFLRLNATQLRKGVICDGVLVDVAAQLDLRAACGPCLSTQKGSHSDRAALINPHRASVLSLAQREILMRRQNHQRGFKKKKKTQQNPQKTTCNYFSLDWIGWWCDAFCSCFEGRKPNYFFFSFSTFNSIFLLRLMLFWALGPIDCS